MIVDTVDKTLTEKAIELKDYTINKNKLRRLLLTWGKEFI